jgi:hypothetical protein
MAVLQALLHAPQLELSVCGLTHELPHAISSGPHLDTHLP